MAKQWDGSEFFRMMADNEKAVAALYRQLAADAKFGGKFFENLARDEDRHFNIYTALLKKYEGGTGLTVNVTHDREEYLDLMIKNNAFRDTDQLLAKVAKITDKDEIFALAESAERDAVLFVSELIDLFPMLHPEDFKIVLNEEKGHLRQVMSHRMESKLTSLRL